MIDLFSKVRATYTQYFTDQSVGTDVLTAHEYRFIESAYENRKIEFSTGRFCAKKALERIGLFDTEILVGPNRQPIWPTGIVGSISHSGNFTGAVVGYADEIFSIGIDVEKIGGVKTDIWDLLYTLREQHFLRKIPKNKVNLFSTLIFSFKESFYKFQYPITQTFLDFKDIEFTFLNGRFSVDIIDGPVDVKNIPFELMNLDWAIFNDQVVTGCILENKLNYQIFEE